MLRISIFSAMLCEILLFPWWTWLFLWEFSKKQKGLFISEESEQPTDTAEDVSNNRSRLTASVKQEAQLSQRSRATLRVA